MNFIDNEHKSFYKDKLKELNEFRKPDVYNSSLIYTLSICELTRNHFKEIFDMKAGEINIDALIAGWQTETSAKVTRMAFNLWNSRCMYDSEESMKRKEISRFYNPSEIFSCSYAPYFYEGIKIRYPEYIN